MNAIKKPYPHLSKAPIAEALVDFRIRSNNEPISLKEIESIHNAIKSKYPTKIENKIFQTNFIFKPEEASEQKMTGLLAGYRFESTDKKFVLQLSPDGFTLSQLPPYNTWNDLINEAKWCWNHFIEISNNFSINRIATRFINKINIPIESTIDFEDYLTTSPKIPENLPQTTGEFLSKNVIHCVEEQAILILTQSFQPSITESKFIQVIIDIDVFKEGDFDCNKNEHWLLLNSLKDLKNDAFFGAIKTKTLDLIK
jgi:uncharacterized protein (TIGR04255 family)